MRWTKNALTMAVHQKEKEQNTKQVQAATIDHIKETQKQKRDTVKEITKDMKMQRESLQQRLAERRKKVDQKNRMNNSMMQTTHTLQTIGDQLKKQPLNTNDTIKAQYGDSPYGDSYNAKKRNTHYNKQTTPKSAQGRIGPQFG